MYSYIYIILFLNLNCVFGLWKRGFLQDILIGFSPIQIANEDAYLNITQLATKYRYPIEEHRVVTEDGYILKLHRIPYGKNGKNNSEIVFLMHGLSNSADCWILQEGRNNSLAYILADQGYDVWMGNARGNKHSNKHVSLTVNSSKYWQFSWEEIGYYDLPAMIDYTLNTTGQKSLYFIGYSQGSTTFFTLTSMRPEYNSKVKLMFALAPAVFMSHATSPFLQILPPAHGYLQFFLNYFNIYSSDGVFSTTIGPLVCKIFNLGCDNLFYSIFGPNNVSESLLPIIFGHSPSGASTFQFVHYAQLAQSERFCRYDYGVQENIRRYGQKYPPDYNLTNIKIPIIIFYGGNDWFSDPQDVDILIKKLPNVKATYFINNFGHSDFIYADENKVLICDVILDQLTAINRNKRLLTRNLGKLRLSNVLSNQGSDTVLPKIMPPLKQIKKDS